MKKINNILVAVDLSEISVKAMKFAIDLAGRLEVTLDVVHILPLSSIDLPAEGSAEFNRGLIDKELEKTRSKLDAYVKDLSGESNTINQHVSLGEPVEEINKIAQASNPDMIVVGTHGRTGLSHLIMGSVAESIVRNATIPVVCVRHQGY